MGARTFSFDRIVIIEEGSYQDVTLQAFLALPMSERIRYILRRQLQFFFGEQPIEASQALAELRRYYEKRT